MRLRIWEIPEDTARILRRWWVFGGGPVNFDTTMPWDWLCSAAWVLSSLKPLGKQYQNLVAYSDLISVPCKITPRTLGWPAFSSSSLAPECASRKESGCSKPKSKPHFPACLRSIAFVPQHWLGDCLQEELRERTASQIMQNCLTFFCKTLCSTEGELHLLASRGGGGISETPTGELKSLLIWNYCWEL